MYDVVIVGACTAGTYFAGLLAKRGLKVLVIDRDSEEYNRSVLRRQYATVCRERKRKGEGEISFDEWVSAKDNHSSSMVINDNQCYPTTTAAATVTPSPSTKSTTSAKAAVAATETPDEFTAATAADRQLKIMQGELGKGVVALTDSQIETLLDKMGLEMFDFYVDKLSSFIIQKGAKVKSHYATILKWWMEDSQDGGGQYEPM